MHFHPERLDDPAKAKKPQVIGVSFYDELFDPQRPGSQVDHVLDACEAAPWHQYVFLTKQPHMAALWCSRNQEREEGLPHLDGHESWWVGVTAETQELLEARAPVLLGLGIEHLWLSIEPILGSVDPTPYLGEVSYGSGAHLQGYDFAAVGCESGCAFGAPEGSRVRESVVEVVQSSRDANVPVFVKQVPVAGRCSRDPAEWPEELRVRQLPEAWERIIRP